MNIAPQSYGAKCHVEVQFHWLQSALWVTSTIRGDWPTGTNDFDYELVRAGSEEIQAGGTDFDTVREFHTFTVAPDTTYWLWVAPYADGADLPTAYDISICGESFDF